MKNLYHLCAAILLGLGLLAPPMAGLAAQSRPVLRQDFDQLSRAAQG
ncbi:MAG: hypothetical protein GH142_09645, partial [Dehalococcoidia bacterium]|nr:hypothetical protein [Dehalococcoidia bacterium]